MNITNTPYDYRALRKHYNKNLLGQAISYDLEGVSNINDPSDPISVIERGMYDPVNNKRYIEYIKSNIRSTNEIESILRTDEFHKNRIQKLKDFNLYKKYSDHAMEPDSIYDIESITSRGRSVGVWNIGYESRTWERDKGFGNYSTKLDHDGLKLYGMTPELAKEKGIVEGLVWGSRGDKSLVPKAQQASIDFANKLVDRLGQQGEGIVYDQLDIAKGFLSKLQQQGYSKALPGDFTTGMSVDVVGRAFQKAGLWDVAEEFHISTFDAEQAHELTNFMANYLKNPNAKMGQDIGKHLDNLRIARAGDIFREKIAQGEEFTEYRPIQTKQQVAGENQIIQGTGKGRVITPRQYVENLGLSPEEQVFFDQGVEKISRPRPILDSPKVKKSIDLKGLKIPSFDFLNSTSGKAATAALGGFALYMGMKEGDSFLNPTTADWGRGSKFGVTDQYMWGGIAEEYKDEMDPRGHSIVSHGTYAHGQIQDALEQRYPGAINEYAVMDYKNKLTGHIDVVVPVADGDKTVMTPVEIKTVSASKLSSMTGVSEEHKAQAQFYLDYLARQNPDAAPTHETFVYVARENPNQYKVFQEARDPAKFQAYLKRYRRYQEVMEDRGLTPQATSSNIGVLQEVISQRREVAMSRTMPTSQEGLYEAIDSAVKSAGVEPYTRAQSFRNHRREYHHRAGTSQHNRIMGPQQGPGNRKDYGASRTGV